MLIYNPRQMALVTCKGKHALMGKSTEKHDIVPTTWHSPASSHPPMYAHARQSGDPARGSRAVIRSTSLICIVGIISALACVVST